MKKALFLIPLLCSALLVGCASENNSPEIEKDTYEYTEEEFVPVDLEIGFTNGGIFSKAEVFPKDTLRIYLIDEYFTRQIIPTDDCEIVYPDISTPGLKEITVSYQNKFSATENISVVETITFQTSYFGSDDTAPDKDYLYINSGAGRDSGGLRFADNNRYWIYKFSFENIIYSASFKMTLGNEYSVLLSINGKSWKEVAFGMVGPGNRMDSNDVEIDVNDSFEEFANNNGDLYIKFADANPLDGFGCILRTFSFNYVLTNEPKQEIVYNTFSLNTNGVDDLDYVVEITDNSGESNPQISSDGGIGHRFTDENASFVLGFDFGSPLKYLSITLEIRFEYYVEYSFDNSAWNELGKSLSRNNWEFFSEEIPSISGISKLYLRFSDSVKTSGFGGALRSVSFEYLLISGASSDVSPIHNS